MSLIYALSTVAVPSNYVKKVSCLPEQNATINKVTFLQISGRWPWFFRHFPGLRTSQHFHQMFWNYLKSICSNKCLESLKCLFRKGFIRSALLDSHDRKINIDKKKIRKHTASSYRTLLTDLLEFKIDN